MTALYAAYRNELSKLFWRKKYIVFLIIGVVFCILWALVGHFATGLIARHGGFFINLTPTPMGALPLFLQFLIPLLIFMGATDLITAESAEHTMRAMIYRPVERWKLYSGKLLALVTYAAIYLACVFFISIVLSQTIGRTLTTIEIFRAFASYALTIPPLAVLTAFAVLIALIGRSGTLTMFILVAAYLIMSILPMFFPIFSELLFTSYLSWHRLLIGVLPGASRLIHMTVLIVSYGAVFFTAGSLLFDRMEY